MTEHSSKQPLLKSVANARACDAKTLAVIAAQFIARGDDEQEALRKANALYIAASAYTKRFASMSADEKAIEAFPEEALQELAEREDLAIGDSEANSPALVHFQRTAKTKIDQHITHKAFVDLVVRKHGHLPDTLGTGIVEDLHNFLRDSRSRKRAERRQKNSVKKNRTKRGA